MSPFKKENLSFFQTDMFNNQLDLITFLGKIYKKAEIVGNKNRFIQKINIVTRKDINLSERLEEVKDLSLTSDEGLNSFSMKRSYQ